MAPGITPILLILAVICATVNAILPLSVVGAKFFTSDGKQFYLKGIISQPVELSRTLH